MADAVQVAVRDGNRLLCPCCGQVLMVLKEKPKRFTPPKMHKVQGDPRRTWPALEKLIAQQEGLEAAAGDLAQALEALQQEPAWADYNTIRPFYRADALKLPIDPKVAAYVFPEEDPPPLDAAKATRPAKLPDVRLPKADVHYRPTRKRSGDYSDRAANRQKQPLHDPFTEEGARLYAWVYYRLQRLAVKLEREIRAKQAQVDRLQAKVDRAKPADEKKEQPKPEKPMTQERTDTETTTTTCNVPRVEREARADLGVAPETEHRGKLPSHAHADEGMAPGMKPTSQDRPP